MADQMKKAKLLPRGGGLVIVVSGWPLAAIIAGGIGYCWFRHYQNEHKNGEKTGFSLFRKTDEPPKKDNKDANKMKENLKQEYNDIKSKVDESYRKTKQTAEDVKVATEHKIDDLKKSFKDATNK